MLLQSLFLAGFGIDINCGVSTSINCSTVLTPAIKAQLDAMWVLHIIVAYLTWIGQGETDPKAAELACYQEILNALKAKCPD